MRSYRLERQQFLPASPSDVFAFFGDAANLERITPAWLHFQFVHAPPAQLAAGRRIEYRIRLAGVPLRWRTRISSWDPPRGFVDVQERGPYRLWEHTHRFERFGAGVLMTDAVRYALPCGALGRAAHALAVRAALASIFDHRYVAVRSLFGCAE
jgi:ligand-binding SRPBCC domain-containing protein